MKSYNKFYWEKNKEKISILREAKQLTAYQDFSGHLKFIHDAIRRYASQWGLDIVPYKKFKRWALTNTTYEKLFNAWKESGFDKSLSPVVMRQVKKRGYVLDNLYWSTKGQHAWWSGLLEDIKNLNNKMSARQEENNSGDTEELKTRLKRIKK